MLRVGQMHILVRVNKPHPHVAGGKVVEAMLVGNDLQVAFSCPVSFGDGHLQVGDEVGLYPRLQDGLQWWVAAMVISAHGVTHALLVPSIACVHVKVVHANSQMVH